MSVPGDKKSRLAQEAAEALSLADSGGGAIDSRVITAELVQAAERAGCAPMDVIAEELVWTCLRDSLCLKESSRPEWKRLGATMARTLLDDPVASVKLAALLRRLREEP